jgi:hypothetical protein
VGVPDSGLNAFRERANGRLDIVEKITQLETTLINLTRIELENAAKTPGGKL